MLLDDTSGDAASSLSSSSYLRASTTIRDKVFPSDLSVLLVVEGIRSGRDEADPILRCAALRLAARLNKIVESWLPRECAVEMRVLEELRAEPREKPDDQFEAALETLS